MSRSETMLRCTLLSIAVMLPTAACSSGAPDDRPASVDGGPPSIDAVGDPPALDRFYADAADAVCGALVRCCDDTAQQEYFAAFAASELLVEFRDRLPPEVTLDEPACREVLAEMWTIVPFGDWIRAAERGDVTFDGAAFAACTATLDGATCGAGVRAALYDGTCLGFAPPAGGAEQRRMFHRTAGVDHACAPIRDGLGAAFFGTCDPTAAFCCYTNVDDPELGCTYPFDGDGVPRAGTCAAAVAPAGACSVTPPLAICQTGASCDADTLRCVAESSAALAVGEPCIDAGFNLLGECVDGFCDIFGTSRCAALRADGAACGAGYECQGGACPAGTCAPITSCDGMLDEPTDGGTPPPDAGVADAGLPDAGLPDAGPAPDAPAADGETCASAFDLATVSTASPLAGYQLRVAGGFGASNDYNPYTGASPALPPACSIVYDASGAELVYAVELAPGDALVMRYEVAPSSVAGGLYLLDTCAPAVTWPDYDHSGACGSNEYRSQGYCGALGCDPMVWTFHYPEAIDGAPTAPRTFWIVADHLAGAPTSFQLDLRID